jgi:hypothetical protein
MTIIAGIVLAIGTVVLLLFALREGVDDIRSSADVDNNVPFERKYATDERYTPRRKKLRRAWLTFTTLMIAGAVAFMACLFLFIQEANLPYFDQTEGLGDWLFMGSLMLFFSTGGMLAGAVVFEGKLKALDRAHEEKE